MLRFVKYTLLLAALLPSACSGCRLMSVDALPVGDPISETMLDSMRQQLAADNWKANPRWSLLDVSFGKQATGELAETRRWAYGSRVVDDVIDELDSAQLTPADKPIDETHSEVAAETSGASADHSQQWDGFWPLNVDQVLNSLDVDDNAYAGGASSSRLGTSYLKRIAKEDSMSGWNAAILLAQRDPQAAREFLPVLERIVVSYSVRNKQPSETSPKLRDSATTATIDDNQETATTEIESIDSLIERAAKQLQDDLETNKKSAAVANEESIQKDESQQRQMLRRLLERVKEVTAADVGEAQPDPIQTISSAMRSAAAEAWCLVLASGEGDVHDQLAPAGRVLERADLPNQVRSELYRAVAREIEPAFIPRLANAMRVSEQGERVSLEVRLAAIESCLIHAMATGHANQATDSRAHTSMPYDDEVWPETILNCRSDSDATIRQTFGRWAAVAQVKVGDADAISILEAQLQDRQPRVRRSALRSLGWLGTSAARAMLRHSAERPESVVRAAAVDGLARWGADELATCVTDESSFVRVAVTRNLADEPSARSYFLMQQLLADDDLQVQAAAVESIRNWPDDPALSLLLTSLQNSSGPTRKLAFQQLRKRRNIRDAFSHYDSPQHEERVRAVEKLSAKLDIPLQFSDRFAVADVTGNATRDKIFRQDVNTLLATVTATMDTSLAPLRTDALDQLKQLRPEDVEIVEQYLLDHPERDAGIVLRELLPHLSPAHAALNALDRTNLQEKRRAASQLRQLGQAETLSPNVMRRLLPHLDGRQDLLVWRNVMAAAIPDATEGHEQVALRALNDERAEVRLLGIEFIQRHPDPKFARWLQQLRLFHDADKRVRLAAITAAGRCGNLGVVADHSGSDDSTGPRTVGAIRLPGLRSLLTHADAETRLAAVVSMSHLGDPQGMQELARLIWNPEPRTRLAAVRAMGETQSTRFLEPLIRRGWTERHIDVRRAILKSLEQLTLPGKRPADLLDETSYDGKIKKWLEWWEASHGPRVAAGAAS